MPKCIICILAGIRAWARRFTIIRVSKSKFAGPGATVGFGFGFGYAQVGAGAVAAPISGSNARAYGLGYMT